MALTERQHRTRATGIGASEVAAVAGLSPFATAWDVYNAKVYDIRPDETNAMRAGTFLEDGVARMYLDSLKDATVRLHKSRPRRDAARPWMLATVDRDLMVGEKLQRLVEIKCPGSRWAYNPTLGGREQAWGLYPDEIPAHIALQAQWQMEVRNVGRCDVVALFLDTRELAVYPQIRNQALIDSLVEICRKFWFENVLAKVPPEIDGTAAAGTYLRQVYPTNGGLVVPAPPQAEALARAYAIALRDEKDAIARKDRLGNLLRDMIGINDGITDHWGGATWKLDSKGKIDWKAVAADYRLRVELLVGALEEEVCVIPKELVADLDQLAEARRAPANRVLRVTYKDSLDAAPIPEVLEQLIESTLAPTLTLIKGGSQ